MIGILSKILGSGDVISKSLDLIDNMHTSSEEEIQAKAKAKTDVLAAYAPFKIAQRMLAFMFGFTYVICFAIVLGMTLSGSGNPDDVTKVMDQFSINYAMLLILGFYFGGGAVEGFMEKKGKK
jgi:quinol-cytochrome oxidoreductase complex cytochrome b subunit|tara:strand:+ start:1509 stop:1877 length:369 start_codon:yes stop_codon:yes gene_type:complete